MEHMESTISESEILELFQSLGIASDDERQRLLLSLGYSNAPTAPDNVKYDIGFNAVLPSN